jgi:hypothetical protein
MVAISAKPAIPIVHIAPLSPFVRINRKLALEKYVALFNPSREEVREFFCSTWQKHQDGYVLTPLEMVASQWMERHPEFHAILSDPSGALEQEFTPEKGMTNPFLHLSMHLSISEQISIDQPPGIRHIANTLSRKLDSEHEAQHQIMECLGQVLWQAQNQSKPIDVTDYIELLKKLI